MLTVYRASAGSGKTHLLTGTYIKMLFTEGSTFRNILAVTFTNKATEEMKERIITQLHLLATDTDKSDYADSLKEDFGITTLEIKNRSRDILIDILHNYSGFNVSTIDKFFQQTTRAFTRELGLQGGFNVELDLDRVLRETIDSLLSELEKSENRQLLEWLISFAEDNIENGRNWNIRKDLFVLAREINKEEYKRHSSEIRKFSNDKENFRNYIAQLKELKAVFETCLKEIGEKGCEIMKNNSLTYADFKGGSRSAFSHFEKWKNSEMKSPSDSFLKLQDDSDSWFTKKTSDEIKAAILSCYNEGLNDLITEAAELFDTSAIYNSATATLRYLYTLGILSDIDLRMRQYSRENNLMLINDTSEMLNKIIDGDDNPFIYEKIGTFIKHFMIDEFQDTSGMQWENFRPLISDSVSQMNDNLIVGDVKQSIYRWRSSDWDLLHSQLRKFKSEQRSDEVLGVNWRSCKNIIEFNNSFFTVAANLLQGKFNNETGLENETIKLAYEDIAQIVSPAKRNKDGHVRVEFIDAENKADYEEQVLEMIPSIIETMQSRGTSLKDIAILVRNSREGAAVANKLLKYKEENPDSKYKYDVISNDSLYISQSKIIEAIVSFLRFLLDEDEPIYRFIAEYNINIATGKKSPESALISYFHNNALEEKHSDIGLFEKAKELKQLSLFDMTEEIINLIKPEDVSKENLFLQSFQDLVIDFCNSNSADLASFLNWWDETGVGKTVSSPEDQDAIKIITIHKSKGLGFDSVIIPFASWKIDHDALKTNLIWCRPQIEPFNELPIVPIKYGKAMDDSIYKLDYQKEKLSAFIDNLNVAYVAFTRAKNEMIIIAPKTKKPETCSDIASVLYSACEWATPEYPEYNNYDNCPTYINLTEEFDGNISTLELGDWFECKHKENNINYITSNNYFSENPANRLQLKLHGKGKFNENKEKVYGTIMHDILSRIKDASEINEAVDTAAREGVINIEESAEIKDKLIGFVSRKNAAQWFTPRLNVINEREILLPDGNVLRPDRMIFDDDKVIVIDYKFGNKISKSYNRQVSGYMNKLWETGYKNTEGYIWYISLDKIVKVEADAPTLF